MNKLNVLLVLQAAEAMFGYMTEINKVDVTDEHTIEAEGFVLSALYLLV